MMVISGGAARSPLVRQIMADTTGLVVALPSSTEPVLLGAAMLGAVAAGAFASLPEAMAAMSGLGTSTEPTSPNIASFHRAKRQVHRLMRQLDQDSRNAMRTLDVANRT
jgi:D-ribulokinase